MKKTGLIAVMAVFLAAGLPMNVYATNALRFEDTTLGKISAGASGPADTSFKSAAMNFLSAPVGTTGSGQAPADGAAGGKVKGNSALSGIGLGVSSTEWMEKALENVSNADKTKHALANVSDEDREELEEILGNNVMTERGRRAEIGDTLELDDVDYDSFYTVIDFFAQPDDAESKSSGSAASFLKELAERAFGMEEEMEVSDLSPYAYVTEIDLGFSRYRALRETVAGWYRLMKTLAAAGFVFSVIFSSIKIAVCGPRGRSDVFCGLSAKALVVICLFGFMALFATYGEIANSIIQMMQQ